jgi:hypothetical protein
LILLATSGVDAAVTLPLDGYCKPGRFFPILVNGNDAARANFFSADGCFPCSVEPSTSGKVIVPMLVASQPHALHWSGGSIELRSESITLRAPGDDERLIASITDLTADIAALFPGKRLIPIHLDPADPLPGPPAAWETLDAIVLDSPMFQRITDSQRSALLAGGVMLVSIGDQAPDLNWPWKKVGSCWALSWPLIGPVGEIVNENVYAPTYAWTPGWSPAVRGQVVGVAAILVMITIALLLRPNRITMSAAIILCLLTTLGIIAWRHSLGSIDRAGGDILIASGALLQRDAFVFERAKESSTQVVPWAGWTHPLFASGNQLNASSMRLNVSATAQLSFSYQASAGHTLAFLRRQVTPSTAPTAISSTLSPMQEAAKSEYLNAGNRITGEVKGSSDRWDAVVIR